jgi:hypothetical protein
MFFFIFPFTSITVLKMFSNTLLSICMTSMLWQNNIGFSMLKYLHASLLKGCTITPSTASCDWCHVMCSAIFGDMNNLCSLGVIGRYLSFLYATKVLPCQSWVYNENAYMFYTRSTLYFQGSTTCRSLDTCQFFNILDREVSSWT